MNNSEQPIIETEGQKEERTFGLEQFELDTLLQMWSVVADDNTDFSNAIKRQIEIKKREK